IGSNGSKKYRFDIYEGPSLNESDENYEDYIFSIHRTIVESEAQFHQILFTLAPGPITGAKEIHEQQFNKQQGTNWRLNNQQTMQSGLEPFLIDCDLQKKWPVRHAKTQNVVREILAAAVDQKDLVAMASALMRKTPRMIAINTSLKWTIKDEFQATKAAIVENNCKQRALLRDLVKLDEDIAVVVQSQTHRSTSNLGALNEGLELVHSDRYEAKVEERAVLSSKMMDFGGCGRMIERLVKDPRKLGKIEAQIASLSRLQLEYYLLRDWISRVSLPAAMMEALTNAKAYEVNEVSEAPLDEIRGIYLSAKDVYSTDLSHTNDEDNCEDYFLDKSDASDTESRTGSREHVFIDSNFPAYEVLEKVTDTTLDLQNAGTRFEDGHHYCDLLKGHEIDYALRMVPPRSVAFAERAHRIPILGYPGINDTHRWDTGFATTIVNEIIAT
ncbi:hypothetical protein BGZ74_004338, partial [Mortierella antarctica]